MDKIIEAELAAIHRLERAFHGHILEDIPKEYQWLSTHLQTCEYDITDPFDKHTDFIRKLAIQIVEENSKK